MKKLKKRKFVNLYGFIILIILVGGIYLAKATDVWQVSGKLASDGTKVTIQGADVDEIKGWSTLGDVIEGFNLNKDQVYLDFNLDLDLSLETQMKELAEITEEALSPATIREYITELRKNE